MRVEIDEHSGFCFGVVNAIRKAEQELERGMLYCIGDIVHNDLEVERLRLRGLKTIEHEQFARLQHCRVLFRAHGEPPVSYEIAQKNEASGDIILTDDQKSGRFSGNCSFAKRERRGTGGGERYDLPESGQSYTSAERVRTET